MNNNKSNNKIRIEVLQVGELSSNCSLIYQEGGAEAVIIDPGNDYEHVSEVLKHKKLTPVALLHTHGHFDHCGQSGAIKREFSSPILIHQADEPMYRASQSHGIAFGINVGKPELIDEYLTDNHQIVFEGLKNIKDQELKNFIQTLKVIHTPGHSKGSVVFYTTMLEKPILIAGDTLFRSSIGRTDLPGGNFEEIISSIKNKIFTLHEETIVITGHGENTTIAHEKRNNPFIR